MSNPSPEPFRAVLTALPLRVSVAPDVLSQEIEGEALLLEPTDHRCYGLNETGTRFWKLLQEDGDIERCCGRLLAEYETTDAKLRADLLELLNQLVAVGLIRVEA